MTRNIAEIAKAEHLVPALQKAITKKQELLDQWADKFKADPFYQLSWGGGAFTDAAELRVLKTLCYVVEERAKDTKTDKAHKSEWTQAELTAFCASEGASKARYSAVPKSSSPTSNLADQHLIQAWFGAAERSSWFWEAQRADDEYKAHWEAETAKAKAEREAKEQADAEAQAEARRQKARERREAKKTEAQAQ